MRQPRHSGMVVVAAALVGIAYSIVRAPGAAAQPAPDAAASVASGAGRCDGGPSFRSPPREPGAAAPGRGSEGRRGAGGWIGCWSRRRSRFVRPARPTARASPRRVPHRPRQFRRRRPAGQRGRQVERWHRCGRGVCLIRQTNRRTCQRKTCPALNAEAVSEVSLARPLLLRFRAAASVRNVRDASTKA